LKKNIFVNGASKGTILIEFISYTASLHPHYVSWNRRRALQ